MKTKEQRSLSVGNRDLTAIIILGVYVAAVALTVSDLIPVRTYLLRHSESGVFGSAVAWAEHLPYVQKIEQKMLSAGASEAQIVTKANFVGISLITMIAIYILGALGAVVAFLIQGISSDPSALKMSKAPISAHVAALPIYGFLLGGVIFCIWLAVNGFGDLAPVDGADPYADHIIETNLWISQSAFFLFGALLGSVALVRVSLCYLAIAISQMNCPQSR